MSFGIGQIDDGGFFVGDKWITLKEIAEELPHGSGIDCDWNAEWVDKDHLRARFYNSWHAMDERGGYCGFYDFSVEIFVHKKPIWRELKGPCVGQSQCIAWPGDIGIKVVGPRGSRRCLEGVGDYIHETVEIALMEVLPKFTDRGLVQTQETPYDKEEG